MQNKETNCGKKFCMIFNPKSTKWPLFWNFGDHIWTMKVSLPAKFKSSCSTYVFKWMVFVSISHTFSSSNIKWSYKSKVNIKVCQIWYQNEGKNCVLYIKIYLKPIKRHSLTLVFLRGWLALPQELSLSPNQKESDLRHPSNLNYILCGHFDEKNCGTRTPFTWG